MGTQPGSAKRRVSALFRLLGFGGSPAGVPPAPIPLPVSPRGLAPAPSRAYYLQARSPPAPVQVSLASVELDSGALGNCTCPAGDPLSSSVPAVGSTLGYRPTTPSPALAPVFSQTSQSTSAPLLFSFIPEPWAGVTEGLAPTRCLTNLSLVVEKGFFLS